MLHLVSDRFGISAYNGKKVTTIPVTTARSIWIVSISSCKAGVFSRVRAASQVSPLPHPPAPAWWLDPEVGMQVELYADGSERNESVEHHLARLISGILNVASAGGRFDDLIVVASPSTCGALRRYLNVPTRKSIVAEIEVVCDADVQSLQDVLRHDTPDRFG